VKNKHLGDHAFPQGPLFPASPDLRREMMRKKKMAKGSSCASFLGAEVTGPKAGHFKCCLPSMIGTTGPEVVRNPSVLAVILHNTCIYENSDIYIFYISI
jgi:hypothetical protein